jgi:hypothetical protein
VKVAHWVMKNGSGMYRVALDLSTAERARGLDSVCVDCDPEKGEIENGLGADIHVLHTHIPDKIDLSKTKVIWVCHGTPENMFHSSVDESHKGHGAGDAWMVVHHYLHRADAIVTFWARHYEIWKSMAGKRAMVECIPMGIDRSFWVKQKSPGKFAGAPAVLSAENCHWIKWPFDLLIAWAWVAEEIRSARLHLFYLPLEQCRWFYPMAFDIGAAYRSFMVSGAFEPEGLRNAFASVDFYAGLVRYGDHNRISLEAHASGCPVISYRGNEYADYWVDEGDQRTIAAQLKMILRGDMPKRETPETPDISETAAAMMKIYERIL